MKKLMKKLKSKAGESLVESLASILIFTMASVVMYTMVTTAADINLKAKDLDIKIRNQLVAVESGLGNSRAGSIELTIENKNGQPEKLASVAVDIYGGEEAGDLTAYFAKP